MTGPMLMAVFQAGPLDGDERSVPSMTKSYVAAAGISGPTDEYLQGRHCYDLVGVTRTRGGIAALLLIEVRVEDTAGLSR